MRRLTIALTLLLAAADAGAQERSALAEIRSAGLPPEVEARLVAVATAPGTLEFHGAARIRAGEEVDAAVVAVGGPLVVAGVAYGPVVVIAGELEIEPGGFVAGDVVLVDAYMDPAASARVGGAVTAYGDADRGRSTRARASRRASVPGRIHVAEGRSFRAGPARFRTSAAYNRVEGLALRIGPDIEVPRDGATRLHAAAVVRTEASRPLEPGAMGYRVGASHRFGHAQRLTVGTALRSEIDAIEPRGLSAWEAALSTAVLHRDPRDYVERSGWSVWGEYALSGIPLTAMLEYRDEDQAAARASSPWALFKGRDPWRLQPVVAEGRLRSIEAGLRFDDRPELRDPGSAWYVDARVVHGLGGSLRTQEAVIPRGSLPDATPASAALPPREVDARFATGLLDVRRYLVVGEAGRLNLRLWLAGALTGEALPPQRQHALGGVGTLPGFSMFALDCGARAVRAERVQEPDVFPAYGCDRAALVQAEYRGTLSFRFGYDEADPGDPPWGWRVEVSPTWAAFVDAGRGWALGDPAGIGRTDSRTLIDAGLGLLFGGLGFYVAVPVEGPGRGAAFFARLERRI